MLLYFVQQEQQKQKTVNSIYYYIISNSKWKYVTFLKVCFKNLEFTILSLFQAYYFYYEFVENYHAKSNLYSTQKVTDIPLLLYMETSLYNFIMFYKKFSARIYIVIGLHGIARFVFARYTINKLNDNSYYTVKYQTNNIYRYAPFQKIYVGHTDDMYTIKIKMTWNIYEYLQHSRNRILNRSLC